MEQSAELVERVVQSNLDEKEFDWSHLKQDVREKLNRFLFDHTKRHPVILPVIMEINQHAKHKGRKKTGKSVNNKQTENDTKQHHRKHQHRGRGRGRKHQSNKNNE